MKKVVLLVGATGMLGSRVAHHLAQTDATLRLVVRDSGDPKTQKKLDATLRAGAELVEGDLQDAASLDRATVGVEIIVSTVQGGPDVIVEGQAALARAAKANGVRRILPSDFALDLFKAVPGEHPPFNWRQEADLRIGDIGLEQVNILQGAFMDTFGPGSPFIDYDAGTISFWGDGDAPIEMTTVEDTARIVVRAALDPDLEPGKFTFWAGRKSFNDVADEAERILGRRFERRSLGDEKALRAAMENADQKKAIELAYALYMTNGQTAMDRQMADRYPDIRLTTLSEMLSDRLAKNGAEQPTDTAKSS